MDKAMLYHEAILLGPDRLLQKLKEEYPERGLYTISIDWTLSMKFVAKAKGTHGDVVVGWYERGDRNSDMPDGTRHVAGQGYTYLFYRRMPQE